jgi:hypothetical protein
MQSRRCNAIVDVGKEWANQYLSKCIWQYAGYVHLGFESIEEEEEEEDTYLDVFFSALIAHNFRAFLVS